MKTLPILTLALATLLISSGCNKETAEDRLPVPGVRIDGVYMEPLSLTIGQTGTELTIHFRLETGDLYIHTYDTIASRYLLRPEFKKGAAAAVLPGRLYYFDGKREYASDSGWLELEKEGKSYSGTFESMAQYSISINDYIRVEIVDGAFEDVIAVEQSGE